MGRGPNKHVNPEKWLSPIGMQAQVNHLYWRLEQQSREQEDLFFLYLIKHDVRPYRVILPNGQRDYWITVTTDPKLYAMLKREKFRRKVTSEVVHSMENVPNNATPMYPEILLPSEIEMKKEP